MSPSLASSLLLAKSPKSAHPSSGGVLALCGCGEENTAAADAEEEDEGDPVAAPDVVASQGLPVSMAMGAVGEDAAQAVAKKISVLNCWN